MLLSLTITIIIKYLFIFKIKSIYVCIHCFSIVVIKHYGKGNFTETEFMWAVVPED